jgi:hypothetical protein
MKRPSEKALKLGEELFYYVPYGLTRASAILEMAETADESNRALLEAVRAVLQDAQCHGGVPTAFHLAHLQRVFSDYEPIAWPSDSQDELAGMGTPVRAWSPSAQPAVALSKPPPTEGSGPTDGILAPDSSRPRVLTRHSVGA